MIRKAFAILLLALFVFNIIGYKIVVMLQMQSADTKLEKLLDKKDYQAEDLFTLKIPINLPYQTSQPDYERVDGEITVQGETYKYVQRKVENDTMYLQCIKHTEKNKAEQKGADYFGKVNDLGGSDASKNTSGKNTGTAKYFSQDFTDALITWSHPSIPASINAYLIQSFSYKGSEHLQLIIKPPQAA